MEYHYEDYGSDLFVPFMVFYDGDTVRAQELAAEQGLSYPLLNDSGSEVFERWDPQYKTPSTTIIDRGNVVTEIDTVWYPAMLDALIYDEEG